MSGTIDTFDAYVEFRLRAWGDEFSFLRDCELLGHRAKDMLQVMIDHKGEMPEASGWKPERPIPPREWQIEEIVHDLAKANMRNAIVMRAVYCGSGRVTVERLATARYLCGRIANVRLSRRGFFEAKQASFAHVRSELEKFSRGG